MFDRELEEFLLEQVRRDNALYVAIMIAFGGCAIACVVMAVAALIIFGSEATIIMLKLLLMFLPFAGGCLGARTIVRSDRRAAENMEHVLNQPESNIPDDYSKKAKAARRVACRNLSSIRQLIVAYGILALTLWGATVLFVLLLLEMDFSFMMLFITFILFAMALGLTILTIAYIRDIPAARKYKQLIKNGVEEE